MKRKTQVFKTAENAKFFGMASLTKSFSNEGKELITMQRTPGNLVRSLECLSKCCHTFNPTCDQEEGDCGQGHCGCPGCACEEMMKL